MLEPLRKRESARVHRVDISHLLMLPDEGEREETSGDEELDECADYIVLYIYENEPWFSIESPCEFINIDPNPTDCSSADPCSDLGSCAEFFDKAISRGIVAYRE